MEDLGFGKIQFWGMHPGCELPARNYENILLLDTADLRYVMLNVPADKQQLFTVYERDIRLIARYLVKLAIVFLIRGNDIQTERIELAHDYAELHGNLRVCEAAAASIQKGAQIASHLIVNNKKLPEELKQVAEDMRKSIDLGLLLQREKDDLFQIFKSYQVIENATGAAFDDRLKRHYGERYNFNHSLCLWDYHFKLDQFMPHVNETFYKSFRTEGVAHLRPYFRLPEIMGGAEIAPCARRAPTEQESRLFCGKCNRTMVNEAVPFEGDITLGPWMEAGFMLNANQQKGEVFQIPDYYKRKVELQRSFQPAGPDSFEAIFTNVELQVVNVLDFAKMVQNVRIRLCTGQVSRSALKPSVENVYDCVVFGLEGGRFLNEFGAYMHACSHGCVLVSELGGFISQMNDQQRDLFLKNVKTATEKLCADVKVDKVVLPFARFGKEGWVIGKLKKDDKLVE